MNEIDGKGPFLDLDETEHMVWSVRLDDVMVMTKFLDVMDNLELGYEKYADKMT
jgi:hypothetical protein